MRMQVNRHIEYRYHINDDSSDEAVGAPSLPVPVRALNAATQHGPMATRTRPMAVGTVQGPCFHPPWIIATAPMLLLPSRRTRMTVPCVTQDQGRFPPPRHRAPLANHHHGDRRPSTRAPNPPGLGLVRHDSVMSIVCPNHHLLAPHLRRRGHRPWCRGAVRVVVLTWPRLNTVAVPARAALCQTSIRKTLR